MMIVTEELGDKLGEILMQLNPEMKLPVHNANEISKIYDILVSITKRLEELEG